MRMLAKVLLAGSACCGISTAQSLCGNSGQMCPPSASYKQVFEIAKGASDGQNRVFQVSAIPAPQYPFRVFRNGLELTPGADFTLQATYITLTGRVIESSGDIIQAAYSSQLAEKQSRDVAPSVETTGAVNEVLDSYLNRALAKQLANTPSIVAPVDSLPSAKESKSSALASAIERAPKSTPPVKSIVQKESSNDYASLRMLATALDQQRNESNKDGVRERHRSLNPIAQGPEGLGDLLGPSPFDSLAKSPKGITSSLEAIDVANSPRGERRGAPKRRAPPSLRMLLRSIQSGQ